MQKNQKIYEVYDVNRCRMDKELAYLGTFRNLPDVFEYLKEMYYMLEENNSDGSIDITIEVKNESV